ncbi:uncharacterized protein VTP21DRAFT_2353 [Calcarisporiella thermophila]|uniref:uncharacterized protein n=1 Tax=Calcarisporiella thermophila TaxID=911321 RepID=UPI003742A41E
MEVKQADWGVEGIEKIDSIALEGVNVQSSVPLSSENSYHRDHATEKQAYKIKIELSNRRWNRKLVIIN